MVLSDNCKNLASMMVKNIPKYIKLFDQTLQLETF